MNWTDILATRTTRMKELTAELSRLQGGSG